MMNYVSDYSPRMGNQDDIYDIIAIFVDSCAPNAGFNLLTPSGK